MEFIGICAALTAVCAACAGFCAGSAADSRRRAERPSARCEPDGNEEEQKELRRRQREIQNFFNYTGDRMPRAGEDRTDTEDGRGGKGIASPRRG